MSETARTRIFFVGRLAGPRCCAVLGSVVLHAVLLAALTLLRPATEPSATAKPGIVVVDLVLLGDADGAGGRIPAAEAIADEPEPAEGAGDTPAATEPVVDVPIEPEPLDTAPVIEAAIARVEPAPRNALDESPTPIPEPAAVPPAAPARTESDGAPSAPTPLPIEPTVVEDADLVASLPDRVALPDFATFREPEVELLADAQREMLDAKLEEWTTDLDSVAGEELVWEADGQTYSATFTRVASSDSMGIEHVLVSVSTEQDGSRWATKMRMKQLAFSSFAQFVDRWDSNVQIHDDQIDGRFHSNSEIFVSRTRGVQPTFRGKVTTARRVNTSNSERFVRRDEVFLGGLETRVKRIDVPQQFVALEAIDDVPLTQVHRFDRDARIVFYLDGSFAWEYLKGGEPMQRVNLGDEPHYLLGADNVSLQVSGIVNGKVLVYAPDDIVIADDLLYAAHPRFDPDSDDFAGLVADRNVVIAESRMTGPGDVTVHGAIFAKRRFIVRRFNSGGLNTLHVYGSLAAGSLTATEPRFRTRLEFDPRLEDARPPGFPVTDRYEVIEWDGQWTEELSGEPG